MDMVLRSVIFARPDYVKFIELCKINLKTFELLELLIKMKSAIAVVEIIGDARNFETPH